MPRYLIHALICATLCGNVLAAEDRNYAPPASKTWIERPWEFRYFISILPTSHIDWGVNHWKKNRVSIKATKASSRLRRWPT